jgi:NAD(P)-dependent dehydrogenase (short-subunit alcohol dehydrogenase family)
LARCWSFQGKNRYSEPVLFSEFSRSVIITGGAAGIGRATALRFADFGCRQMLLVDINEEGLQETKSLILERSNNDVRILLEARDLSTDGVGQSLVKSHVKAFGRLDYLVNVAGRPGGFLKSIETDENTFDSVQGLNVRGTYFLQQAAIKQMLTQEIVHGEYGTKFLPH